MIAKTIRGADLGVYINGIPFSLASSITWMAETGREAIKGVDQDTPFELAPNQQTIKGTISLFRKRARGGLEAQIVAPERLITYEKYFSLIVIDRITDTVVLAVPKTSHAKQNWQVASRSIMTGILEFEGISWTNEV